MRGLYAHASERMRRELTEALQRRWEDSLRKDREPAAVVSNDVPPRAGRLRDRLGNDDVQDLIACYQAGATGVRVFVRHEVVRPLVTAVHSEAETVHRRAME